MIKSFTVKLAVVLISAVLLFQLPLLAEQGEQEMTRQQAAIEKLRAEVNERGKTEILVSTTKRGDVAVLAGQLSQPAVVKTARSAALDFVVENRDVFNIQDVNRELALVREETDAFGLAHVNFRQLHNGVPVWKRSLTVHFDRDRQIHAITSDFVSGLTINTTAGITAQAAIRQAKTANRVRNALLENAELVVYHDDFSDNSYLAYAVDIANFQVDKTVIIDARSGAIITEFSNRHSAPVNGIGTDAFGNTVNPLHLYEGTDFPIPNNATWQDVMGNAAKGNFNMVDLEHTGLGNIYGLDANHTDLTVIDFIFNSTSTFSATNQTHQAGVSGAVNFEATLDYFKIKHNRNGIDNAGMPVIHIQDWFDPANPINAFWSGGLGFMAFSLGGVQGGTTFRPLSAATDVVGHELAHGVTDRTSGLVYQNHSGALNEAWSDMFGYLVEAFQQGSYNDWLLGEDVYQSPPSAFRSLSDPPQFGDPDNINHPSYIPPVGNPNNSNDFGGVHTNSGIPNKMFYLLVNGGTHYGIQVDAFDANIQTSADLVAALMYLANTGGYFTANTNFDQARDQTIAAVQALYPGDAAKLASVQNAWASVGIGSPAQNPAVYATLPYSTGFESGSLDQHWNTQSSNGFGRIQVSSANGPQAGSFHLTMDSNTNSNFVQNESWLHLDLSGETQVELSFQWKEFGDETHTQDGVFFSDNGGASFVKVQDLNGQSFTNNTWQSFTLDLDQLASANGLSLSGTFVVKFQQYDNFGITTDGHAYDEISVTGSGGSNIPPVANANGPYNGTEGVAVNFSSAGSNDPDGSITGYLWDFGDTNTSTAANPSHAYTTAGTYNVSLTVTDNLGAQHTDNTTADISAAPTGDYATLPYATGFESGAFDQFWSTASDNDGRIRLLTSNTPHTGSFHLVMDDAVSGGSFSQNDASLRLDLSGETQVNLTFWWKEFGDETHAQDGVYFSDNGGSSFVKVQDLNGQSFTNNTWQQFTLDLDALAAANALSLSSTFVVKFTQYDNYPITSDGFAIDDIDVSAPGSGGGDFSTLPYSTGF